MLDAFSNVDISSWSLPQRFANNPWFLQQLHRNHQSFFQLPIVKERSLELVKLSLEATIVFDVYQCCEGTKEYRHPPHPASHKSLFQGISLQRATFLSHLCAWVGVKGSDCFLVTMVMCALVWQKENGGRGFGIWLGREWWNSLKAVYCPSDVH